jgi:multiple sugar transport system substrate-binding protein
MNGTRVRSRRWLIVAVAALTVGALSACGDGNGGGQAGSADKADLTWQFWVGGSEDQQGALHHRDAEPAAGVVQQCAAAS